MGAVSETIVVGCAPAHEHDSRQQCQLRELVLNVGILPEHLLSDLSPKGKLQPLPIWRAVHVRCLCAAMVANSGLCQYVLCFVT